MDEPRFRCSVVHVARGCSTGQSGLDIVIVNANTLAVLVPFVPKTLFFVMLILQMGEANRRKKTAELRSDPSSGSGERGLGVGCVGPAPCRRPCVAGLPEGSKRKASCYYYLPFVEEEPRVKEAKGFGPLGGPTGI